MRHPLIFCVVIAALLSHVLVARAEDPAPQKPVKVGPFAVLFIGNSYTSVNNLPAVLVKLGAADKPAVIFKVAAETPGGVTLQKHLDAGKAGKKIAEGKWDFVVLQEQSQMPFMAPQQMHAAARKLDELITAAGAKTVFYMTWAKQAQPENFDPIAKAYTDIAAELKSKLAPAGMAWRSALKADPDLKLYQPDGSHPTEAGTYLAACVMYQTLTGRPAPATTADLKTLTTKQAEELRKIVAEVKKKE